MCLCPVRSVVVKMSASFQMFLNELQKLVKSDIIGNYEKASIASIMWVKFKTDTKHAYKAVAREYNKWQFLTGRRKVTGFWWFASELLTELREEYVSDNFVEKMFNALSLELQTKFTVMNEMNALNRRNAIFELLYVDNELL